MYYDLGHVHSNLGEFQYRFLMQNIRFSVPPLLPRLLSSNVILCDQYLLYVFMYSWVYNGAPQPAVLFTLYGRLHTDDRPDDDHFSFPFCMGSCTRRLNLLPIFKQGRTSRDFNENQPKHQNRNFLKTFCNYLWWNLFIPSFNLILDIPITKLTELWL